MPHVHVCHEPNFPKWNRPQPNKKLTYTTNSRYFLRIKPMHFRPPFLDISIQKLPPIIFVQITSTDGHLYLRDTYMYPGPEGVDEVVTSTERTSLFRRHYFWSKRCLMKSPTLLKMAWSSEVNYFLS